MDAIRLDLDQGHPSKAVCRNFQGYWMGAKTMAQEQTTEAGPGKSGAPFMPKEFANFGQQAFDSMMGMQKGYLEALQDLNQRWVSGVNAEAALASEFFTKLAAAKSIPEAATACQDCANRQMEILADNSRQLMAASEKIVPGMLGNGFRGAGT
jgi:hypothetical protein